MQMVSAFLRACKGLLPVDAYTEIESEFNQEAYAAKASTWGILKNCTDDGTLSQRNYNMLIRLMNNFSDGSERRIMAANPDYTWYGFVDELESWDAQAKLDEASPVKEYTCRLCGEKFSEHSSVIEKSMYGTDPEDLTLCMPCLLNDFTEIMERIAKAINN